MRKILILALFIFSSSPAFAAKKGCNPKLVSGIWDYFISTDTGWTACKVKLNNKLELAGQPEENSCISNDAEEEVAITEISLDLDKNSCDLTGQIVTDSAIYEIVLGKLLRNKFSITGVGLRDGAPLTFTAIRK